MKICSRIYRGKELLSDGDTVAKDYVKKNLAKNSAVWSGDKIADDWTKNDTSFSSILWGYDM